MEPDLKQSITISIPAYNDENTIENVLSEIHMVMELITDFNIEVLVIDDGSQDSTHAKMLNFQNRFHHFAIEKNETNQGFGYTFKKAFIYPQTDWVFFNTADHQFPMENLIEMAKWMPHADLILGKRAIRRDHLYRRIISRIYNFIISFLSRQKVTDVNSIMLFKRSVLENIELKSTSAFINAEFVLKTDKNGFVIKQIDIEHRARKFGVGSGGKWSVVYPTLVDLLKYLFKKL